MSMPSAQSVLPSAGRSIRPRRWGRLLRVVLSLVAAVAVVVFGYLTWLWPWMQSWGATGTEISAALPGDDLVPNANLRSTKGITVQATPAQIYPWLLQIGVDRGGMYSYDWLENLFGLKVNSTDRIVPDYQNAQVGDFWRFTPKEFVLNPGPGLYVQELRQDEAVLLCFGMEGQTDEACVDTWQFVLQPQPDGSTRLLLRSNMQMEALMPIKLTYFVQFIMERKMLLTFKERAESS